MDPRTIGCGVPGVLPDPSQIPLTKRTISNQVAQRYHIDIIDTPNHLCGGVDELSLPTTKIRLVAVSSVLDSQTGDRLPRLLILLICKFLYSSYVRLGKLEPLQRLVEAKHNYARI
jgi:hypothetical protein